tara:strand:- start:228 stop:749 length:522 start_codon:yes stop_codon:yes gene_type:complete
MAITSAVTNTFKAELFKGGHNFNTSGQTPAGNAFKLALYSSASANLDGTTTTWTVASDPSADPTNTYEVTTTSSGYASGGKALTNLGVTGTSSTTTSFTDFADLSTANGTSWTSATFTTHGCLIYNTTAVTGFTTNRSVCVVSFGGAKTVSNGTFSIEFPTASTSAAILRITS